MRLTKDILVEALEAKEPVKVLRKKWGNDPNIPLMEKLVQFAKIMKTTLGCRVEEFSIGKDPIRVKFTGPDDVSYDVDLNLHVD